MSLPEERLISITAPYFVAGLIVSSDGFVIRAAPILRYAKGKSYKEMRHYFARRGWKIEELLDGEVR